MSYEQPVMSYEEPVMSIVMSIVMPVEQPKKIKKPLEKPKKFKKPFIKYGVSNFNSNSHFFRGNSVLVQSKPKVTFESKYS